MRRLHFRAAGPACVQIPGARFPVIVVDRGEDLVALSLSPAALLVGRVPGPGNRSEAGEGRCAIPLMALVILSAGKFVFA